MISFNNVTQKYPYPGGAYQDVTVLDGINLEITEPSINMLLGPSGCGKSTLMRMAGGVRPFNVTTPTDGDVKFNGEVITGHHEDAVTVFQHYANFPNLTVRENLELPFKLARWKDTISKQEVRNRITHVLMKVGLIDKENNRPSQLSGGQNQRVALAQAFALKPKILLMDEPFGALDEITRKDMQTLLLELWREQQCHVIFITHDIEEALLLGDRIIVLSTKPAKIALDFNLAQPRPRSDVWLNSTRIKQVGSEILATLAEGTN
jgi:NitT/TauT family transport system ATP-binding protein